MPKTSPRLGPGKDFYGMLMAIFGAGASYDCVSTRNRRLLSDGEFMPPLASELFERRGVFDRAVLRHPTMWPIIDRLRYVPPEGYVEGVLEEIKSEAETFPINFNYLASLQFYLREVVYSTTSEWQRREAAGATNYSTLMGMLWSAQPRILWLPRERRHGPQPLRSVRLLRRSLRACLPASSLPPRLSGQHLEIIAGSDHEATGLWTECSTCRSLCSRRNEAPLFDTVDSER